MYKAAQKIIVTLEVCRGRIFQTGPSPARMATISAQPCQKYRKKISVQARPGPARPEREIEISVRARPGQFSFRFRPRQLDLRDFKTGPFSCLHILNAIFWQMIYFTANH